MAFTSLIRITGDVNYGFILRYLHANGAGPLCFFGGILTYRTYRFIMVVTLKL